MDKKAQESFSILLIIPRMIFLIIVMFSIYFLIRAYVVSKLDVQDVQVDVFINKVLYSPNGISYYDRDLKRSIPGLINPSSITDDNLNKLADYDDSSFISAKIQLIDNDSKEITSALYNGETYSRWLPVATTGVPGPGGYKQTIKSVYVNFLDQNKIREGTLKFDVLIPGS